MYTRSGQNEVQEMRSNLGHSQASFMTIKDCIAALDVGKCNPEHVKKIRDAVDDPRTHGHTLLNTPRSTMRERIIVHEIHDRKL
jgi:acetylornithine/succinyldiaminopimelate/putrescine aminotransferase